MANLKRMSMQEQSLECMDWGFHCNCLHRAYPMLSEEAVELNDDGRNSEVTFVCRKCSRMWRKGVGFLQSGHQPVGGDLYRVPDAAEANDDGRGARLRQVSSNVHLAQPQLHASTARVRRAPESDR